jgi:hypothetical protein
MIARRSGQHLRYVPLLVCGGKRVRGFGTGSRFQVLFRRSHFLCARNHFGELRTRPETNASYDAVIDQHGKSIMSIFLALIYRAYCRALIAKMQKYKSNR